MSDVSGRGVGMDVVKRNINELGGYVQIHSSPGRGSMVRIRLPLTLAILDGQLARVGSEVYVVPIVSIVETIQVRAEQVSSIANRAQVIRLRDDYLPIVRLHELFDIEPEHSGPAGRTADDRRGRRRARRAVRRRADVAAAGGDQESRNQLPADHRVRGATMLGDGRVALILDVPGVISRFRTQETRDDPAREAA